MGLTVAVTGPTGEIGKPFVRALERRPEIERIVGMARRPFDPAAHGWTRTEYVQGDVLDPDSVARLVDGADVVVHLAFIIIASGASEDVNLTGSRNVFAAAARAGVQRLVYASSVAAYGFHDENALPLTEDTPARGTHAHPYSEQKAMVERVLTEELDGSPTDAYVFRPCIVAGPEAPLMLSFIPYIKWGDRLPGPVRALFDQVPILKPVLPDPGVRFQLVHHDDVADALCAAVAGEGRPGIYNLAADGDLGMGDVARELGYYTIPVPELLTDATAEVVSRLPFMPAEARWIEAFRVPVVMSTMKTKRELGWRPRHDARDVLHAMVAAARSDLSPA